MLPFKCKTVKEGHLFSRRKNNNVEPPFKRGYGHRNDRSVPWDGIRPFLQIIQLWNAYTDTDKESSNPRLSMLRRSGLSGSRRWVREREKLTFFLKDVGLLVRAHIP